MSDTYRRGNADVAWRRSRAPARAGPAILVSEPAKCTLARNDPSVEERAAMLKLTTHSDRESWDSVLATFPNHDFGHTYDFHLISEHHGEGTPILFHVTNSSGESVLCWPALRRTIEGSEFFDLTSVYGYSGALINDSALIHPCLDLLFAEMTRMKIVTFFVRTHPLLGNLPLEAACGSLHVGNIVVIDVKRQRTTLDSYRINHRRDIRKALQRGVITTIDRRCQHLDEFVRLYHHTMHDLGAREYYLFDQQYFSELVAAKDMKATLIFAKYNGIKIGAILLLRTRQIVHYYLGGADRNYMHFSPLKVMMERAHRLAIEEGVDHLVLGGGPGGFDDPLVRFKQGFSGLTYPFHIIKKIVDQAAYQKICADKHIDPASIDFFPAYRAPLA